MISFLATSVLAVSAPAGGDHAALHPAGANLYFEVPDIPAAIDAYQEAPLVGLFRDEEIGGLVRKFAGEEATLSSLCHGWLREGLGENYPRVAELASLLASVRSASLSVSGLEGGELASAVQKDALRLFEDVGLLAVLEFPDGASTARLIENAGAWLATPPRPSGEIVRLMGEESEVLVLPLSSKEEALQVWIVPFDRYLAIGLGASAPSALELRGRGEGAALIEVDRFRVGLDRFEAPEGVVLLECFTTFRTRPFYIEFLRANLGEGSEVAEWLISDLLPTGGVLTRSRLRLLEGRFVSETYEQQLEDPGMLARAFQVAPVTPEALSRVHPEAVGVWATTFDASALSSNLVRFVARLARSNPEDFGTRLKEDHGLDLDSILSALGNEVTFYLMPISGPTLPKVFASVEITDPSAVEEGLMALGGLLESETGGLVTTESKPYRKVPVIQFRPEVGELARRLAEGDEDIPVPLKGAPTFFVPQLSFAVLPDRVLVALSPIHAKREVRRLVKGLELPHPVVQAEGLYPPEATATGYLDWGSIFEGIYDAATAFLPLVANAVDFPIEVSELPDGSLFRRYFRPSISWSVQEEGGSCYTHSQSSFGPEVQALLAGTVLGALWVERSSTTGATQKGAALEPGPSPAGEEGGDGGGDDGIR